MAAVLPNGLLSCRLHSNALPYGLFPFSLIRHVSGFSKVVAIPLKTYMHGNPREKDELTTNNVIFSSTPGDMNLANTELRGSMHGEIKCQLIYHKIQPHASKYPKNPDPCRSSRIDDLNPISKYPRNIGEIPFLGHIRILRDISYIAPLG